MVPAAHICLFGGSFDPVHTGHTAIAAAAQAACGLDKVLFLPAACSPFKQGKTCRFSDVERLEMLHLATAELPWVEVSEVDLKLPPPSWSWRLVEHFSQLYPHARLYWLLGTDQWEALHRWARYEYLTEYLHFIVYHRGTAPQPRAGVQSTFLCGDHPASASAIRAALQAGTPVPQGWLHPAVEEYMGKLEVGSWKLEV